MATTILNASPTTEITTPDDLPYALVTPGEWEFSEVPSGYEVTEFQWHDVEGETGWYYEVHEIGGGYFDGIAEGAESDMSVAVSNSLFGLSFTATRASLPGRLFDRAVNAVSVSSATTLTLPPAVPGRARDFLVWAEISNSAVPAFAADGQEQVSFVTGDGAFPEPDSDGLWSYSFTEMAQGVFAVSLVKLVPVDEGSSS